LNRGKRKKLEKTQERGRAALKKEEIVKTNR